MDASLAFEDGATVYRVAVIDMSALLSWELIMGPREYPRHSKRVNVIFKDGREVGLMDTIPIWISC